MNGMKLRLLTMGTILSLLGIGLVGTRGPDTAYFGLLGVGIVLLLLGLAWKQRGPTGAAPSPP